MANLIKSFLSKTNYQLKLDFRENNKKLQFVYITLVFIQTLTMHTSAIIFVIFTIVTLVISESHDFELYAFEQPLDHFNSEDNRTWNQIYYINDDFYIPGGPVFIYLDAPAFLVEPVPLTTILTGSRFTDIAEKSSGRIISIQSRFYGLSQPTEYVSYSTDNIYV